MRVAAVSALPVPGGQPALAPAARRGYPSPVKPTDGPVGVRASAAGAPAGRSTGRNRGLTTMPRVLAVGTALPPHTVGRTWPGRGRRSSRRSPVGGQLLRVFDHAGVKRRHLVLRSRSTLGRPGFAERNRSLPRGGGVARGRGARAACRTAGVPPGASDHLVFVPPPASPHPRPTPSLVRRRRARPGRAPHADLRSRLRRRRGRAGARASPGLAESPRRWSRWWPSRPAR